MDGVVGCSHADLGLLAPAAMQMQLSRSHNRHAEYTFHSFYETVIKRSPSTRNLRHGHLTSSKSAVLGMKQWHGGSGRSGSAGKSCFYC